MERAVVVDFTDEVEGLACSISRNEDCGDRGVRIVDDYFYCSYLRLLPPVEGEVVAIGVGRAGGYSASRPKQINAIND